MDSYRGMNREALDRAYNNTAAVPDVAEVMADFGRRSAVIYGRNGIKRDLAYGEGANHRIDWIPGPHAGAPTIAYIHGGYWQSLSKEKFAHIAAGPLSHGFNVALIEYTLAPEARIGTIVSEIGRAIDFLATHLDEWRADPARLCLVGHSAGGHLAACHRSHPAVSLIMGISGLYDLEPIRLSYLNEKLDLTPAEVEVYSPERHASTGVRTLLTVGSAELPELRRQTADYASSLRARGELVEEVTTPGYNHFTILETIALRNGAAIEAVAQALS
ncbi:alpha/beta hydrolase [Granulicella mallensis]|uniref:Esterase n=1 Tax=Granulicella mallensis (strain ATCC BAA-1857 / DSM 23137 / MP5ACTX8) TaxID=682795 RepID=G8NNQ6_GRAMM|nr:alpha/beta hydrolase [Granulicella mallensis]AEU35931.1 esterase [Granulicella mallensis MP5ACTX8]